MATWYKRTDEARNEIGYPRLVHEIAMKAVDDYVNALNGCIRYRDPGDTPKQMAIRCETYFRSDWFEMAFGGIDPEWLINHLREKAGRGLPEERRGHKKGMPRCVSGAEELCV